MSQAPSMPMYWDAYLADTTHLTTEEHGAYLLLLAAMWRRNGTVPDDDKDNARILGLTKTKWLKVKIRLSDVLIFENNHISQKKLQITWKKTQETIEKNRVNGAKGGRPKSNKNNNLDKAVGFVSHNPNETIPEPEPDIDKDITKVICKKTPEKKGCRIDGKFKNGDQIPDDFLEAAIAKGLTLERANSEFEKFINYWTAASGKNAIKRNWLSAWRTWIANSVEWAGNNNANRNGQSKTSNASPLDAARELISEGFEI